MVCRLSSLRRIVGVVEVEQYAAACVARKTRVVEPEQLAALDRIVQIASGAIRLAATGGVAEWQEEAPAVHVDPIDCQTDLDPSQRE